jgi:4-hydroxybenzoate polyprenyltransferase
MNTIVAVGRLTRLYTILIAGAVVYAVGPGAQGAQAGVALAFVLAGAFAFNDLRDREADAVNVPNRPIPSGAITGPAAAGIALGCFSGGVAAALLTRSPRVLALTLALAMLLFAYSIWLKPVLGVKNIVMALVGAGVPLFGSVSHGAQELAVAIGLFILQKEIVADVYDHEGDARVRLRTLPVALGDRGALLVVIGVNAVFVAFASFLALPIGAVVIGVGITNVIVAVAVMHWRRGVRHLLRLQQCFLLAGLLFMWM